ncbi:PBECR4 domain-containing protein [Companilactobacillus sp. HBUAS59544]|uniref:PBECR4 domain-containing protein n=1 Tax=Companilactobacillus sp. HBUAS59544 TaxID=3109363 RepID=UPI003FA523A4
MTGYHVLSTKDRIKFNQNFNKLKEIQLYFDRKFKNRRFRYFYLSNKKIFYIDFKFNIENYMHLCGFKYRKGAKKFWMDLIIGISDNLTGTLYLQYDLSILSLHKRFFQLILLPDRFTKDVYVPVSLRNIRNDRHSQIVPKRVICIKCLTDNEIVVCDDQYLQAIEAIDSK